MKIKDTGASLTYAYNFAFDTANLDTGVEVYTPTVGELLVDAWISVLTGFDGTTPRADISQFTSASPNGLWGQTSNAVDLSSADSINHGGGPSNNDTQLSLSATGPGAVTRAVPADFVSVDPLLLVVSQDGTRGGTPIDGAAGSAVLYFTICTPIALN
jgi:hypothetical protein